MLNSITSKQCKISKKQNYNDVISYVGSFAINTFGGSPTDVAVPPMFENMQTAINIRTGSIAMKIARMK